MRSRFSWLKLPLFFFLINLLLKGFTIDVNDLAHDEPFTVFFAQQSIGEIFQMLKTENNPPLYFLILHQVIEWSGIGTFSVRFPALLFSALTASLLFLIGNREIGRRAGVLAALLFTFSNYHLGFAQEARVYALFGFLTAGSMYFFLVVIRSPRSTWPFVGLCLMNVLLPYAHFFGWLVIGIQVCTLLFKQVREGILLKYAISIGIVLLAYAPYVPILWSRTSASVGQGTWLEASNVEGLYNMIWDWSNAPVMAVFFIAILGFSLVWHLLPKNKGQFKGPLLPVLLLWFLLPFLGMWLISFKVPMFLDRYLIYASLGFYLLLALLFETFWRTKWLGWSITCLAVLGMAFTFKLKKPDREKPRLVALEVKMMQEEGRLVLISPDFHAPTFSYHYDRDIFMDHDNLPERLREKDILLIRNADQLPDLGAYHSVVYLDAWAELVDPEHTVVQKLRAHYSLEKELELDSKIKLYLFSLERNENS